MTGPKRADRDRTPPSRTPSRAGTAARPAPTAGSTSLYERYKEALRRGHVAALRGRHDAAIDAYGQAASIAPDRALPHASIGGILAKMNRPADAVAAYRRALALAPRDETALRGIAEVLTRLGRRTEAAAALDRLAEGLDIAGRLPDATDTARRALELAESRPRRTQVEALVERLREAAAGDDTAELAIVQALRTLGAGGETAVTAESAAAIGPDLAVGPDESAESAAAIGPDLAAGADEAVESDAVIHPDPAAGPSSLGPDVLPETEPSSSEPEPVEPAGLGIALGAVAEAQLHNGQLDEAREGLLAAARAHRRAGRLVAAVDACDLAIAVAPADPDLHLLLAELYLDRGWRSLATEKLLLLGRIADLDGDRATRDRLCAIAATRLADEPRLADLCA